MKNDSWMKTLCVCGTVVACAVVMSQAGPLDPPGGPVASSYKTLDQVEARFPIDDEFAPGNATSRYVITSSGSYYLTGPLNVSGIDNAIEVRAPNVTIDLNGFTITSSTLFGAAQRGIFIAAGVPDAVVGGTLTVKNGTLTGFTGDAIGTFDTDDSLILRDVVLKENGVGVSSAGDCDARGCLFIRNTGSGISTGRGSVVRDCRAIDNGSFGINVFGGAVVDCVVRGSGVDGISLGTTDGGASMARNNVVNTSAEFGISCLNAIIEGNAIAQNTRGGIRTETVQGFSSGSDGVIARNFLRANGLDFDQGAIEINAGHYRVDENTIADANVGVLVRGGAADKVITRNTIDNTSFAISLNTLGNVTGILDSDYAGDRAWQNLQQ